MRVANDRMAGAIRMVSLARGHDPRDFALFAFGGAGPLHAAALARELGIPKVLIPARPGLTNALGCLVADLRHDFVATINQPLEALAADRIAATFTAQIAAGRALLERENVATERIETLHRADMQFQGQSHILPVAIASTAITIEELRAAFAAAYWKRFSVELPEIRPVLVNLHTAVIGKRPAVSLAAIAGLDHRRAIELLDDRRPVEAGAGRQMLANVDRRRMEGVVEPDRPGGPLRLLERRLRPTGGDRGEGHCRALADHRGVQVHQHRPDLGQLDAEALPVGGGKGGAQLFDRDRGRPRAAGPGRAGRAPRWRR